MKFQNGRKLSSNAVQAIRFVAKVGAMSRQTWYELFSHGTIRWRQMQLQHLIDKKVFKNHTSKHGHDAVVFDEYGIKLVNAMGWKHIAHLYPHFIQHDETVGAGLWKLEREKICQKWMTEGELELQKSNEFKLRLDQGSFKFPDAVFKLHGKNSSPIIAVEYEKTVKSVQRYRKAIRAYCDAFDYSLVLFVTENEHVEKTIGRCLKQYGDLNFNSKVAFMRLEDWRIDPARAPFRGYMKAKNFEQLVN